MDSVGLVVLFILAAIGVLLSVLMIPDVGRFLGYFRDGTIPSDLRWYSGGLAFRNILPGFACFFILSIGALVKGRQSGYVVADVGDALMLLSIMATAAIVVERFLTFLTILEIKRARKGKEDADAVQES